jgi:hypothetical protein
VPLRSPAPVRRRLAFPRCDVSLFLEAIERGIDRPDGHGTTRAVLDFAPNRDPVPLFAEMADSEEYQLLEFPKKASVSHDITYIVDEMSAEKVASSPDAAPGR